MFVQNSLPANFRGRVVRIVGRSTGLGGESMVKEEAAQRGAAVGVRWNVAIGTKGIAEKSFKPQKPFEMHEPARAGSTGHVAPHIKQIDRSTAKSERKNVGQLQETETEAVGKFERKSPNMGKSDINTANVKSVEIKVGKLAEDTVGKSIGKAETMTINKPKGIARQAIGKSVRMAENQGVANCDKKNNTEEARPQVEEPVHGSSTPKSLQEAEEGDIGKASLGKGADGDVGKSSTKSLAPEVRDGGGNIQNPTVDSREFVIGAAGKSESEMSYVESLIGGGELKLPEGAGLAAYEQTGASEDGFRVNVFMEQLTTRQFGRVVFYAREMPSTHTLLSQNCKSLPVGTLSVADVQFQGKGRAGNSWESPKGCLMFSFTLEMSDGRAVPFVQYVASLAIIEGIESHCGSKGRKAPEVRIKWPNDLYAKGVKVGGVLCTSTYGSKKFNIVVGVGLNVGNRQPTTCLDALMEEMDEEAPSLCRDELLAAIMSEFEELFEVFCRRGFPALESEYYRRWLHSGQTVVLEERQEGEHEVSRVPLKIEGLTASGYLRAVDDASEAYELHPDGNSFDFLKGLVRKKM